MKATIQIDSRGFTAAARKIAEHAGVSLRTVIDNEAGAALTTCANRTKVGKKKNVIRDGWRASVRKERASKVSDSGHHVAVTMGWRNPSRRGNIFYKPPGEKLFYVGSMTRRSVKFVDTTISRAGYATQRKGAFKNHVREVVKRIQADLATSIPRIDARRGLAVSSWLDVAEDGRLKLGTISPSRAKAAASAKSPQAGIRYKNGHVSRRVIPGKYTIKLTNTLPYNHKIGMDGQLKRAVRGRVSYFRRNLKEGVFDSAATIARAYPGITVTR